MQSFESHITQCSSAHTIAYTAFRGSIKTSPQMEMPPAKSGHVLALPPYAHLLLLTLEEEPTLLSAGGLQK